MGSSGRNRTTQAKLNRESKLREKRIEKRARKAARNSSTSRDDAKPAPHAEPLPPNEAQHN